MTPNIGWAKQELQLFIAAANPLHDGRGTYRPAGGDDDVTARVEVIEEIFERFYPGWQQKREVSTRYKWHGHRELAQRCLARLERREEVRQALGDSAPTLSAGALQPWVWDGARSLWNSGHYREAVEAAAKSVNAYTQTKVNRRDISEEDLFVQAFSDDEPKPGAARLRPSGDDDSKSARSVRRGIRQFASGCYAAIRNPKAHDDPSMEILEHEALEQLAAFSVLARWVERSTLYTAE